jgi:hypothetical protein
MRAEDDLTKPRHQVSGASVVLWLASLEDLGSIPRSRFGHCLVKRFIDQLGRTEGSLKKQQEILGRADQGLILVCGTTGVTANPRAALARRQSRAGDVTIMQSMLISNRQAAEQALAKADVVIPPRADSVGLPEWHQIDVMLEARRGLLVPHRQNRPRVRYRRGALWRRRADGVPGQVSRGTRGARQRLAMSRRPRPRDERARLTCGVARERADGNRTRRS